MSGELWRAPLATGPVDGSVALPGSKSITNRALVIAALADRPSTVRRPLRSRDTLLMANGLRAMGTVVEDTDGDWRVTPGRLHGPAEVDVGNAGTVMRFLPPVAALAEGAVAFDGDPRARQRPLAPILAALRGLGTDVTADHDRLPVVVHGRGWLLGGTVTIDASASSQFVSALLLTAPRFANGLAVRHTGGRLPSAPHIALTVTMLRRAGVLVEDAAAATWRVEPGPLRAPDTVVEPDLSNAAPFLAAALVTGGRVHVPGWPRATSQPGDALRGLVERLGGRCELGPAGLTVQGGGRVTGLDADLGDVGELAPVIAALAALADGPSRLWGLAHLRGHETDRLAALARELNDLGGDVTDTGDGLLIRPRPLHGGVFATYDDHRLATAAAVLGLVVDDLRVENVATTDKTLPGFPGLWLRLVTGKHA